MEKAECYSPAAERVIYGDIRQRFGSLAALTNVLKVLIMTLQLQRESKSKAIPCDLALADAAPALETAEAPAAAVADPFAEATADAPSVTAAADASTAPPSAAQPAPAQLAAQPAEPAAELPGAEFIPASSVTAAAACDTTPAAVGSSSSEVPAVTMPTTAESEGSILGIAAADEEPAGSPETRSTQLHRALGACSDDTTILALLAADPAAAGVADAQGCLPLHAAFIKTSGFVVKDR